MNTKRMILSIVLVLAVIASLTLPQARTTILAEDTQVLTIENTTFYDALKKALAKYDQTALQSTDDERQQITLDMEKVTTIEMELSKTIEGDNFKNTMETLFRRCTNLKCLKLKRCDLTGVDLSALDNRRNLSDLTLVDCQLDKVPDLTLPNLETMCLSKNNLSADGACDRLTKDRFSAMTSLWLDDCQISDIGFLQNMGNLQSLSLADNRLTDDAITALIGMENLSGLQELNLGVRVHVFVGDSTYTFNIYTPSKNTFTDLERLASLPVHFPDLEELELSGLRISSIREFTKIESTAKIIFEWNYITDYTGLESNSSYVLSNQRINLSGIFAIGQENEFPELLKRILDPEDVLYSSGGLTYTYCHLSPDDETKIILEKDGASVKVESGKLRESEFIFRQKKIPSYTVPENLSATAGDILATVILPEGFSWKDPALDVGEVGTHMFKAIFTPRDTDTYVVVDDIDVPVTVRASQAEPTPTPIPTPTLTPTPTPEMPTPTPEETKQTVITPTPKPDESKLSGNQIEKRKDLSLLLAAGKQKGSSGIKLTWRKKNGCSGYEVYWSYCDGKQNFKKMKTVGKDGKRECIHKKLKKTRAYKYYIATYTIKDGRKNYQSKSPVIHIAMKRESHTNAKRIKVNKAQVVLKEKKAFQIKAAAVLENPKKKLLNHDKKFRYYVDNKDVASVDKKGKIKAKKKGTCSVFVIANNGVAKQVKVTVK